MGKGFGIIVATCATALIGGCGAHASQASSAPVVAADCAGLGSADAELAAIYSGAVRNVQPIHRKDFRARAIQLRYVAGASFDVPAPRSTTAAYLERALSCHAAGRTAGMEHPNDPLRVAGVHDVDVRAVGARLRISVTGADRSAGKAILQRAEALSEGSGSVKVKQLAANTGNLTNL